MGITGLLPFLEKASSPCHLRDLRGKCVAIDSYCWLHRGAFGCAERLARGEQTDAHVQYCLKYVQLLVSYGIKPILVFDGRHLPAKAATEAKRREGRENARKRGAELLRLGRIDEARKFLRRCVDITHEMALQLIRECRKRHVDCVVAPYEADAQLAYLNRIDIAQYVVTEDSDLVLFGCNRIIFKLDLTGHGRLVESSKLHLAMGCREDRYEFSKFRQMCILSGCDYLDSLPGIGLAKACRFVLRTEDPDVRRALAKIPAYLNMRQVVVSEEYKEQFLRAEATFKHMVVYDPVARRQTRLNDPAKEGTPEECLLDAGVFLDEQTAFSLALGNLDPFTLRTLDAWHPDNDGSNVPRETGSAKRTRHPSIWKTNRGEDQLDAVSPTGESQSAPKAASFVKRPPINADFEQQGTKDSIDDVLHAYGIDSPAAPPLKRLCQADTPQPPSIRSIAIEYEDVNVLETMTFLEQPDTSPRRSRNPFFVATRGPTPCRSSPNALLSPTKLTPENRSLLQNISPVKRTEYSTKQQPRESQQEISTTVSSSNTTRLSRFKRTNTTATCSSGTVGRQKVISRFFCTQMTTTPDRNVTSKVDEELEASLDESPTAIVRKIKDKRHSQQMKVAEMYLRSPEARLAERGDRTPEKRSREHRKKEMGAAGPSGALVPIAGSEKEDLSTGTESDSGMSSSQKENDDITDKASESVKDPPISPEPKAKVVRLALFERQPTKKMDQKKKNETDKETDDLAIALDDDDDEMNMPETRTVANDAFRKTLKTEHVQNTHKNGSTTCKHQSNGGGPTIEKKPKPQSACRKPGLSKANGRQASKSEVGLTQSRLSMFGFQKKV
ncbi:exonuclease 1 [Anopheles cruzii]|uniref:exonuclease 1 n=1 Tax=Anopheles cruzii TaxID=68878 RepID=UPI0022EC4C20|nr:exonuclease 1 [Anopheles cruzii]